MTLASSTYVAAEILATGAAAMVRAKADASGSARRSATIADVSTISAPWRR
jgi:hypothetical protein